jgi:hypothetical protein
MSSRAGPTILPGVGFAFDEVFVTHQDTCQPEETNATSVLVLDADRFLSAGRVCCGPIPLAHETGADKRHRSLPAA